MRGPECSKGCLRRARDHEGGNVRDWFHRFARSATHLTGTPVATVLAFAAVAVWVAGGLKLGFGTDYQMYINTGTTIVTFLMVFLIQNTQNHDARAMHLKLDELIRGVKGARTSLVDLEEMTEAQLDELEEQFRAL